MEKKNEIIVYHPAETLRIEVRMEDETVWLTQAQMAELFETTPQNITLHIKNIYNEQELAINSTCKESLQVRQKQLTLDIQKHNAQYDPIDVEQFRQSHDRFLIIDKKDVYHLGASLKDLGKKWFAFSLIHLDIQELLKKIEDKKIDF